jgi:ribosomal protein L31
LQCPDLPNTLTDRQAECVKAYFECDESDKQAAKELEISLSCFRKNLWYATKKGVYFGPDKFSPVAPVGWDCSYSTIQHKNGEVVQQWDRVKPILSTEEVAKYLESRLPVSTIDFPKVRATNENLMLEWPVFDVHHGMLAWGKETGNDYDHKISKHLQISAGKILFSTFGPIKRAVIILGGDNQTADNREGKTEKSGNILDTDTRYAQMAWTCFEAAVSSIEIACQFAESVYVVVLSGNHDYHAAIHLTIQLHAYFRNIDKIEVDISPARHRFYSWGKRVVMATHGDINEKRVAPFALQRAIRNGYATDPEMRLYVLMGHLHKQGRKTPDMLTEEDGVIVERFPTIAAQEAYSIEGGYTSCRATSASLWHHKHAGRYGFREITVGEILERYPYDEP